MPADQAAGVERIIRARRGLVAFGSAELWRYRELFFFLAWRDILVRYKQTYLGIAWVVLQPVLMTAVFVLIFEKLGKFDSHGAPYAVMTYTALLPWQFFANALTESSNSLVASSAMISKVYFPRLIIPASAVFSGIVDFLVSAGILFLLMAWYGVPFDAKLLLLPLFLFMAFLAAFAAGVWLSALNVKYRDVKYVVPFFTRIGVYVSPVAFMTSLVPEPWRFWYSLNPMVGAIDGFRWCVLGSKFEPSWPGFWLSLMATILLMIFGLQYFRNSEKTFADLI